MSNRTLLATGFAGLLGLTAFAGDAPKRLCCASSQAAVQNKTAEASKLRCTITGKVVEKCCCTKQEGKTRCTLADKDVEKCCCAPAEAKQAK